MRGPVRRAQNEGGASGPWSSGGPFWVGRVWRVSTGAGASLADRVGAFLADVAPGERFTVRTGFAGVKHVRLRVMSRFGLAPNYPGAGTRPARQIEPCNGGLFRGPEWPAHS